MKSFLSFFELLVGFWNRKTDDLKSYKEHFFGHINFHERKMQHYSSIQIHQLYDLSVDELIPTSFFLKAKNLYLKMDYFWGQRHATHPCQKWQKGRIDLLQLQKQSLLD